MRKTDCMWPSRAWWVWCRCDLQWECCMSSVIWERIWPRSERIDSSSFLKMERLGTFTAGSAGYPKCVDEISPPLSRPVGFVACMELHAHHGWWLPEAFRATDLRPVLFISVFPINCLVGSVLSLSFRESPPHICPHCRVQWHLC